ncbi:4-oxalomesaconate tautomerase [Marinomonas spartinae]|uniref:4-oxalomesaconate tautomerase n=1 Tax=Marinomonas spartinae TaxID=1792290 RepID=A0A1A8TS14_9GAMM|nr:4-oxalomesaconate tautomerase [Marinomonas spartinae]SBS31727.1 4-oxalomesaconate tautomerase [Marinomonas spartinae]SBS36333.1 4-oxalomesaconate tautomerase [Marinomonas spartinae]
MSKAANLIDSAPCMWMRGGTSKGGYFLASDLPEETDARDQFLLRMMGSPDDRQIDGMGGADPLASKVAVVKPSQRDDADVDYLFLQVFVDQAIVTDAQNCGNLLAGVGPFAIERGLVAPQEGETTVRIFMENTGQVATAQVSVKEGKVCYQGRARIDGVPGFSAAVPITFNDTAGSSCGALLPTGNVVDVIDGVEVTCIDNGMPVVVMRASDMGITGRETREELEANEALRAKLESIRLQVGPMMNLGDVKDKSVPKMTMVSAPVNGGAISTRTFIPHRCHASIGVLGAVSVATAAVLKGAPANDVVSYEAGSTLSLDVEHPIGSMTVILNQKDNGEVSSAAILRTARKLFDGQVFAHDNGL